MFMILRRLIDIIMDILMTNDTSVIVLLGTKYLGHFKNQSSRKFTMFSQDIQREMIFEELVK